MRRILIVTGAALLISGCASRVIREPARLIGEDIAGLQGEVSSFQDSWRDRQATDELNIIGYDQRARAAASATRQIQTQWAVSSAANEAEAFQVLKTHAEREGQRAAPAAARSAEIKFPVDKMGEAAAAAARLARKPDTSQEAQRILAFAKEVNQQLAKIEEAAKANSDEEAKNSVKPPLEDSVT